MGEADTPKVIGKLYMTAIEWEVPDFFNIEEEVQRIASPKFPFMGTEWCLWAYPNGAEANNNVGWLALYLIRVNSIFKQHHITYRLGIRKEDGTEHYVRRCEYDFPKNGSGFGSPKFLERSTLLKDKDQITSTNTLKFFCTFHETISESKVTKSQTVPYENLQTLVENLKELLNGEDGDIVLKVQSIEFKAHKAVLKVRSPVFRSMFTHKMKEDTSGVVEITDCDPTAFKDFLHFVYCGKVEEFSTARVFDLFFVADKYDVVELKTMCTESIIDNLSTDTFFDALNLALKHQESSVLKHATDFFIENAIQIAETAQWLSFQKENLVAANELFIKTLKNKIPQK